MNRLCFRSWLLLATLCAPAPQAFALKWGEFHAERHDRFYQSASPARAFIGEAMDWSGVGTWQGGWATMISDSYFVTAYHVGWSSGQPNLPVQFYRTNVIDDTNPANFAEINIDTSYGTQIAGTDLYVGRLTQPVPSWVRKYPLIKRNDQTNWLSYLDTTAWIYGRAGDASIDPDYAKARVGKNRIYSAFEQAKIAGTTGTVLKWSSKADAGSFGMDEVSTISGDSSGPTFVASHYGGGLALAGLHSSYDTDTSVAAYLAQIDAVVPEPISIVTDVLGDFNWDFKNNVSDFAALASNFGRATNVRYSNGDVTGDGIVDVKDLSMFANAIGADVLAPSDFNRDGYVDSTDLKAIGNYWLAAAATPAQGDANKDGRIDQYDIAILNANWRFDIARPRPLPSNPAADLSGDGLVDDIDLWILMSYFGTTCNACAADYNRDGQVNAADISIFGATYQRYRTGDINSDGMVNNADMSLLLSKWHRSPASLTDGDINRDNIVNEADFALMADWWGWGTTNIVGPPTLNSVPEPATAMTLLAAALSTAFAPLRRR